MRLVGREVCMGWLPGDGFNETGEMCGKTKAAAPCIAKYRECGPRRGRKATGQAVLFLTWILAWSFNGGVSGTGVGGEFLVTLLLVILLHGLKSASHRRGRRLEYPRALRTCPALKISCLEPQQVAAHRHRVSRPLKKGENIAFLYRSYEQRKALQYSNACATNRWKS